MVKKNIKPSFNRNVKLLIPKKEVRGCRAELISIINKNIPKISYKGHEFVVPKWECHLILGEGSKETYLQIVDTSFIEKTLNYLKINNDYYDLYSKLIESLPKLFKDLPSSKILFYNYVIDNNKITPNYFVEKILLLTEQIFPANEFSNKVLDLSEIIIHKKSHRIRMRVFAGAICGNYMTNKLN